MKTNFFKYAAFAVVAALAAVSCSKDDDPVAPSVEADLIGTQTADVVTLTANGSYTLSGKYIVPYGKTLKIEEGVTITAIDDNTADYILIQQGATIEAIGTQSNPIVMTSQLKEAGAWGGIHICGYAKINSTSGHGVSEVGDSTYGGSDDTDNSGTLKWIRIEYAGYIINEGKEANGFTFYGVGNGTTLEYLHAYEGADDGFEWFGGCVNAKYLISTNNQDDSFDWTEGYRGTVQYAIANQTNELCARLIEGDNDDSVNTVTPQSCPTFANVTLIGKNSGNDDDQGVRIRVGSKVRLLNVLISGKTTSLRVSDTESIEQFDAALTAGYVAGIYVDGTVNTGGSVSTTGLINTQDFSSVLSNTYYGTIATSLSSNYASVNSAIASEQTGSPVNSTLATAGATFAGAIATGATWASALEL
ncbi:MAG: hypothetical protein SNG35_07615 [Rikenellaceae bacterium]